jgi:hypothetical protein
VCKHCQLGLSGSSRGNPKNIDRISDRLLFYLVKHAVTFPDKIIELVYIEANLGGQSDMEVLCLIKYDDVLQEFYLV